jgi:hypothetical protein
MPSYRFELPEEFYTRLAQRLELTRPGANSLYKNFGEHLPEDTRFLNLDSAEPVSSAFLPSVSNLRLLVSRAFSTSLQFEEGRPLRFVLDFLPPTTASDVMAFNEPFPFHSESVVKLAPAIGTYGAAMCVWPFAQDDLRIWGRQVGGTPGIRLVALDPGLVVVKFGNLNVARIAGGEAHFVLSDLAGMPNTLWDRFAESLEDKLDRARQFRMIGVLQILRAMRYAGHGGALIVVQDSDEWRDAVSSSRYCPHPPYTKLADQVTSMLETDTVPNIVEALRPASRDVALLANVDGAVILDNRLNVLNFGAKLQARESTEPPQLIAIMDPLEHENRLMPMLFQDLGGMRHQSAARFVFDNPESIAFVVSQDGNITTFISVEHDDSRTLFAYLHVELTCF